MIIIVTLIAASKNAEDQIALHCIGGMNHYERYFDGE